MKVIETESSLRCVAVPGVAVVMAFLLGISLCIEFVCALLEHGHTRDLAFIVAGIAVCGVGAVLFAQHSEFIFDRAGLKLDWRRRGLVGAKGGTIPFDQISAAFVECRRLVRGGVGYRVSLVTSNGILPMTLHYTAGRGYDDKCRRLRSQVNRLLGRQFLSEDENDVRQLVLSNQRVGGELLAKERLGLNTTQANEFVRGLSA